MSGVAVVLRLDLAPVGTDDLRRMVEAAVCRGPHGLGIADLGRVTLAHRVLHATP